MKLFEIQTLSECNRPRLSSYNRLAQDPTVIITAGVGLLSQLFPNIFGGSRRRLTQADWLQIMPGSGYWTTSLRNYLQSRIHYDVDINNMLPFSRAFMYENRAVLCDPYGYSTEPCWSNFLKILDEEKMTGGVSPVGQTPGGIGATFNWETILLLGGGVLLLTTMMKRKKRRKK